MPLLTFILLVLFVFLLLFVLVGAERPVGQAVHPDHLLLTHRDNRPVSSGRRRRHVGETRQRLTAPVASAHLVGVLQDEVLALVQLAADVDDATQDAPGVLHAQVDLAGKLVGLELLRAQDDVAGRVLHVVAGDVAAEEADHKQSDHTGGGRLLFLCVCVCAPHPSFRYSDPASMAQQVQRASL